MTYGMPMGQHQMPAGSFSPVQPNWQPTAALAQQIPFQGQPNTPAGAPRYAGGSTYSGRGQVAGDRLPPQPDMNRRPAAPMTAQAPKGVQEPAQIIRGAAPEETAQARSAQQPVQSMWKPIRIPTPGELGILVSEQGAAPAGNSSILAQESANVRSAPAAAVPQLDRFDLASVLPWLDAQGARKCQREKLAEGVVIHCVLPQSSGEEKTFSARGVSNEAALRDLVGQISAWRQQTVAALR